MRILYIHQYFATPRGKTGTRSYEFARQWIQEGHDVTMLTSQAQLTPDDLDLLRNSNPQASPRAGVARGVLDGIEVIAIDVPYRQQMGFLARLHAFTRFMLQAVPHALTLENVDVIYATSTPLTIGVPALAAWWLKNRPYVFEARDVWPDIPIAFDIVRNPLAIGLLRRFERRLYRHARAVVALSPGAAELIRHRCPPGKRIEVAPNCCDTHFFSPDVDGRSVRRAMGWENRFVCLHAGAMGRANGLDIVVRAAERFRDDPDYLFILIGEGGERERLRREAEHKGLTNLQILDPRPKREMPGFMAAADVGMVLVANVPVMEHNSANKFFDALSAGRPVLLNYGGWQREVLERYEAGRGCPLGDDEAFFERLAELKTDPDLRTRMGAAARILALEEFDRTKIAHRVLQLLEDILPRRETPEN